MKPDKRLSAILASPDAMRRPRTLRREAAAIVAADPLLRDMRIALDRLEAPDVEAVFNALTPFGDRLDRISSLLRTLVSRCADDTLFTSTFAGGHDPLSNDNGVANLTLFDHPLATVSLHSWAAQIAVAPGGVVAPPLVIQTPGRVTLLRGLGPGFAVFHRWSCAGWGENSPPGAARCQSEPALRIDASRYFRVDGRREAIAFHAGSRGFAAVQISATPGGNTHVLEFDPRSGRCINALPANVNDSRIMMMLATLRQLGRTNEATLARFLEHPNFAVRWQAMRELLALLGPAGTDRLETFLARERHPSVLEAGHRTRALLQQMQV